MWRHSRAGQGGHGHPDTIAAPPHELNVHPTWSFYHVSRLVPRKCCVAYNQCAPSNHTSMIYLSKAGVSNIRPAGRIRLARWFHPARTCSRIHSWGCQKKSKSLAQSWSACNRDPRMIRVQSQAGWQTRPCWLLDQPATLTQSRPAPPPIAIAPPRKLGRVDLWTNPNRNRAAFQTRPCWVLDQPPPPPSTIATSTPPRQQSRSAPPLSTIAYQHPPPPPSTIAISTYFTGPAHLRSDWLYVAPEPKWVWHPCSKGKGQLAYLKNNESPNTM